MHVDGILNAKLPLPYGIRMTLFKFKFKDVQKRKRNLTIDSDLAITITVTSGEESLGLLVSESSGGGREVLQEQPGKGEGGGQQVLIKHYLQCTRPLGLIKSKIFVFPFFSVAQVFSALLQLLLLNEATVVLVNDGEGLLDIICALAGQTACLEELLVVEGVSSWNTHVDTMNS